MQSNPFEASSEAAASGDAADKPRRGPSLIVVAAAYTLGIAVSGGLFVAANVYMDEEYWHSFLIAGICAFGLAMLPSSIVVSVVLLTVRAWFAHIQHMSGVLMLLFGVGVFCGATTGFVCIIGTVLLGGGAVDVRHSVFAMKAASTGAVGGLCAAVYPAILYARKRVH